MRGLWLTLLLCGCAEPRSTLSETDALALRQSCAFAAGAPAWTSVSRDVPTGRDLPIDHVIVLVLQGRSFDHLFSSLEGVEAAAPDAMNRSQTGDPMVRYHLPAWCVPDLPHDWNAHHTAWSGGAMDGFARAGGHREVMGWYDSSDLPGLYAIAKRFALADGYHASALAPPEVNRLFLYAGTSFGATGAQPLDGDHPTLFGAMDAAGVDWAVYSRLETGVSVLPSVVAAHPDRFRRFSEFTNALDEDKLPAVSFIDPLLEPFGVSREDFGAPGDIQLGDDFLVHLVQAIGRSPAWSRTALFITFVEDGGLYDHVAPPAACAPDGASAPGPGGFDRLGFRVPLIVVSPWARPGLVAHATWDHTSIARFIEARFHLPALTARDANADPLSALFDFERPHPELPELPSGPLDPDHFRACDPDQD
jgi:phospholipase C